MAGKKRKQQTLQKPQHRLALEADDDSVMSKKMARHSKQHQKGDKIISSDLSSEILKESLNRQKEILQEEEAQLNFPPFSQLKEKSDNDEGFDFDRFFESEEINEDDETVLDALRASFEHLEQMLQHQKSQHRLTLDADDDSVISKKMAWHSKQHQKGDKIISSDLSSKILKESLKQQKEILQEEEAQLNFPPFSQLADSEEKSDNDEGFDFDRFFESEEIEEEDEADSEEKSDDDEGLNFDGLLESINPHDLGVEEIEEEDEADSEEKSDDDEGLNFDGLLEGIKPHDLGVEEIKEEDEAILTAFFGTDADPQFPLADIIIKKIKDARASSVMKEKNEAESMELSMRTKRLAIAVGPNSFARRKKKMKKA